MGGQVWVIAKRYRVSLEGDKNVLKLGNSDVWVGLPQWLSGKESACNAGDSGDMGLIPESGRSPGGRNGDSLQYSCRENPMDRGAWRTTVHEVTKNQTRLRN